MKNIVLIGMMGAGKSTVGSCLGNSLDGFSFVDMDNEIEKHAGLTIAEIFANHGESYFRTLETQLLESYSRQNSLVISTGGGIVERSENLDKMKQNCVAVSYTHLTLPTILRV